jgi:crotonobetainyl-CoA:carnitine CoA-transferase CaiB-like acyl-CoA transferase
MRSQGVWPPPSDNRPNGPLTGIRVLDLSRILAGPFATMILADLGADVVKVERPGVGDETRRWGPPFAPSGDAAYFYACNRGRRSVALDLRDPADLDVVLDLVTVADVLVENFLPGAMERLGLDAETLQSRNPRLIRCGISGYGRTSSRASWPALDFVIQAHAGILGVTGSGPQDPLKAGVPIADLATGLYAVIGIFGALRTVAETGRGTTVEVALADACASLLVNQAMSWLIGGVEAQPRGNAHPSVAPYQTVRTQDRLMAIAASSDEQFRRLCDVLGLGALVSDARFASNADRVVNRADLIALLEDVFLTRPAATWVVALNEAGVAAAVVNTVGEALDDEVLQARLVASVGPDGDVVPQLRLPIWFDGAPVEPSSPPPALGADNDFVVQRLQEVELP